MDNQLSIYTPSNTKPEILEEILVQRHKLLDRSVAWCAESLTTSKKNHLLFVGPRGSGKTHMVSMIVNRLREKKELEDKMLIVWLGEDDIVTNFLDLVLSILRYLAKEYDFSLECLEEAKGLKSDKAANIMLECINEQLNDRKILLIKENLSDVFNGLKDMGQKQLRAYLQEQKNMVVLATSQQLFKGVSSRDAVFFGFFDIHYLKPLSVDDAMELIEKVSALKGDEELRRFVKTPQGRYRVRALHHLAGGNQRLYMDLLSFLTKESLDDLVSALSKLADDLTPYFQERIKSLAPQQGLIVQKLCEIEGAISVKDLAEEMFIGERSVAKQLGDLKEKGYVLAHRRGKLTYYEISEPLMRLSLQVKHTRGKPLKILVLLLRAWYSNDELSIYTSIKTDILIDEYIKLAMNEDGFIINAINSKVMNEIIEALKKENIDNVINLCSEIVESPKSDNKELLNDAYFYRAYAHWKVKKYDNGIDDISKVLMSDNLAGRFIALNLFVRAKIYADKGQYELAIKDFNEILKNKSSDKRIKEESLFQYAEVLYENKDDNLALKAYQKYSLLDSITEEKRQYALMQIADIYLLVKDLDNALKKYLEILDLSDLFINKSKIYLRIVIIYMRQKKDDEALLFVQKGLGDSTVNSVIKQQLLYQNAVIYFSKNEYSKALNIIEKLLEEDLKEDLIKIGIYALNITIYYTIKDIQKARKYFIIWKNYMQEKNNIYLEHFNMIGILMTIIGLNKEMWDAEIRNILKIMSELQELEYLSKALISSINYFTGTIKDIAQFKNWQLLWEEVGAEYEYLQPALKALKATRLAVEEKSDKPLFALPKEIRELVLPMVEEAIKE